jgi:hypothetical protein
MVIHLSFLVGYGLYYDDGVLAFIKKIRDIAGNKGGI